MGKFCSLKGHDINEGKVIRPFSYAEENGFLEILVGQFWEKRGLGKGQLPSIFLVS